MDRRLFERLLIRETTRRRLLGAALGFGAAAAVSRRGAPTRAAGAPPPGESWPRRYQGDADPFTLGVASGDPGPHGVVLWTRLAPDPLNGGGMGDEEIKVAWEIATDDGFTDVVAKGAVAATPELAHSVHIEAEGLEPATPYVYRFAAGDALSPIGRTRTAPAEGAPVERLRFGFASCAHYEHGFFPVYRHMAEADLDVALFLGDYIYEYGTDDGYQPAGGAVRSFGSTEPLTLADYRNRHALYKTDPDLQAAHAACPWIVTWDDHEVENDYTGLVSGKGEADDVFLARRAAAYQAYYEHMPLRASSMPVGPEMRLYRERSFGDLARFFVLDTRQYRTPQPCAGLGPRCDAALDPVVTMTGSEQEAWLLEGLGRADTRWNVIAQQVMMAQLDVDPSPVAQQFNNDQWDGYPLARQRILDRLVEARTPNPIVLSGDLHTAWVNDLKGDFDDSDAPAIATEFVTTSVTSSNPFAAQLRFAPLLNPHLRYYDARHGYAHVEVTPARWQTDLMAVESVATRAAPIKRIATWVVEDGVPGATRP